MKDDSDPTPIYRRGLWFDGNDYVNIRGLVLHHSFTLQLWARVTECGDYFSISASRFTSQTSEDVIRFDCVDGRLRFFYAEGTDVKINFIDVSPRFEYLEWYHFAATARWE